MVGATRQGRLGRILLGDDTAAVIRRAPCSAAVAPAGLIRGLRSTKIGVVYDGSPEGLHAVEVARELTLAADRHAAWAGMVVLPAASHVVGLPVTNAIDARSDQARNELLALDAGEVHEARDHHMEQLAAFSGQVDLLVVGAQWLGRPRCLSHSVGRPRELRG